MKNIKFRVNKKNKEPDPAPKKSPPINFYLPHLSLS